MLESRDLARAGVRVEQAGKAVRAALKRVAGRERSLELLQAAWPLIVGVRVAAHSWPRAWEEGRLEVAVGDVEWHEQLGPLRNDLRCQINNWWGATVVADLSLVRARLPRAHTRRNTPAPAAVKAPAKGADATRRSAGLDASLETIQDAALRQLVERVAARYLGPGKRRGEGA